MSDESTLPTGATPEPLRAGPDDDHREGGLTAPRASAARVDLARIERDLAGVEAALGRLDDGTYWTDEVTGAEIPDAVLAADPVTRRAG